jgi:hypothetical protein
MKNKPDTSAESFPALAARGHRKRIGSEVRVLLSSTTVDVDTKFHLGIWQIVTGRNLGGVLDDLVGFAKSKGYPRSIHKKAGAGDSTPAAPAPTAKSLSS